MVITRSRLALVPAAVNPVLIALIVLAPNETFGLFRSDPSLNMKPSQRPELAKRRMNSRLPIKTGLGLKARFRKAPVPLICVVAVIWV